MTNFVFSNQSENLTWEQFQGGNQLAFAYIYHYYYNDLYGYGCKLIGNAQIVEDCIQDFFLYLWEHRESLSSVNNIKFYLIKSFRRRVLQKIKQDQSREKRNKVYANGQEHVAFSFEVSLIDTEVANEKHQAIIKALNLLSPRQKEVVYLKYFNELSYKEIAKVLDLNYQTVVNHFYDAFKVLKKHKTMILATIISISSLLIMTLF